MKFYQRLAYYLFGLLLGSIAVFFIFNKRGQDFSYMPNARTKKNITEKPLVYSVDALRQLDSGQLDTAFVNKTLKYGDVDFDRSKRPAYVKYVPIATTAYDTVQTWKFLKTPLPVKGADGKLKKTRPFPTSGSIYVIEGRDLQGQPKFLEIVNCDSLAIVAGVRK